MTREELIARTRQLIDEGSRLLESPGLGALQLWLQLSVVADVIEGDRVARCAGSAVLPGPVRFAVEAELYGEAVELMRRTHNRRPDTRLYHEEAARLLGL